MKPLKSSGINSENFIFKALATEKYIFKAKFESEKEAKKFFDKCKKWRKRTPEYLKPK